MLPYRQTDCRPSDEERGVHVLTQNQAYVSPAQQRTQTGVSSPETGPAFIQQLLPAPARTPEFQALSGWKALVTLSGSSQSTAESANFEEGNEPQRRPEQQIVEKQRKLRRRKRKLAGKGGPADKEAVKKWRRLSGAPSGGEEVGIWTLHRRIGRADRIVKSGRAFPCAPVAFA
jgi:hypothetical protein